MAPLKLATFYTADRRAWRRWLRQNYKTKSGVWLVYYRKNSGKPRIPYNDAVEEALCFGWIDSTLKKLDDRRFAQKFSPRKPKSGYSQANKERLASLAAEGKLAREVLATLGDILNERTSLPLDILAEVKSNKKAWRNFQRYSEGYKRIRIAFIDGARNRPAEFRKRLNYFIKMTAANRQFGFGGIDEYY